MLSNSLGATLEMWDPQAGALAERFRLVRYDTRGHGGSRHAARPVRDRRPRPATCSRCSTTSGIERAHFAGLSLGGMTGMWLGVNAPERIDRLVLLCTSPLLGPPRDVGRPGRDRARAGHRGDRRRDLRALVHRGLPRRAPDTVQWLRAMFAGVERRGLRELLRGSRAHGPDRRPAADHARRRWSSPARRTRRRRRRARRADRRRDPAARGWRSSTPART